MANDIILDFQFRNSPLWIDYSHKRYLTLEEIKKRLKSDDLSKWETLKLKFDLTRKSQGHPFPLKSLDKIFWYFPADCVQEKIANLEHIGTKLYETINNQSRMKLQFIENAAVEEAITSAIYEGANSTRTQAKKLIASQAPAKTKDDWMLINNHEAMKWIKTNASREVDLDLIREIHALVTRNTLEGDDANYIGKFRDDKVYVGPHEGIQFNKIEESLSEVIELTTKNARWIPPIIRGILLHYFIGYIHPFFDGNGRTARTLFYFKCFKHDIKFVELLSISADLKNHGKRYERAFENAVLHDLDITYFIDFCADSLVFATSKVETKINYLLQISKEKARLDVTDSQVNLLQRMALNKFKGVTSEEHATNINRTRDIARKDLKALKEKKYLIEKKIGKKLVYFIQPKVLKADVLGEK